MSYLFSGVGDKEIKEINAEIKNAEEITKAYKAANPEMLDIHGYYFHPTEIKVYYIIAIIILIGSIFLYFKSKPEPVKRIGQSILFVSIVVYLFNGFKVDGIYLYKFPEFSIIHNFIKSHCCQGRFASTFNDFNWHFVFTPQNIYGWSIYGILFGLLLPTIYFILYHLISYISKLCRLYVGWIKTEVTESQASINLNQIHYSKSILGSTSIASVKDNDVSNKKEIINLEIPIWEQRQKYSGYFVFFKKHLNGDYSLAQSYWINTCLISMFVSLLGVLIQPWLRENFPARYSSAGFLLIIVIGIAVWIWAIIGTWTSADKHVARGGKQGWVAVVKTLITLAVFRMFVEIGQMTEPLSEHWKVALGRQPGPEISFQVRADGKSLLVKGGINDGSAEALSKALDIAPSVTTVVFDSTGGWIKQGSMIAKVISVRQMNTYVEKECSSACTIAFLAGRERSADPNARIGFHSFKSVGTNDKLGEQYDIESVRTTYSQASLSPSFIAKVVSTSSVDMWYPSHDELINEGILTRQSFGGETATVATFVKNRKMLATEFQKIPAFDALSLKYPAEFEQVVDKAWAKVEARKSDGEVMASGREQLGQLTDRLFPIASDASLIESISLTLDQAEALSRKNAVACVGLVFPTSKLYVDLAALLPPDLVARQLALMNGLIRGSDARNAIKFSKLEFKQVVMKAMATLTPAQVQMLESEEKRATDATTVCTAIISYLRELNAIPEQDRARSLRILYSNTNDFSIQKNHKKIEITRDECLKAAKNNDPNHPGVQCSLELTALVELFLMPTSMKSSYLDWTVGAETNTPINWKTVGRSSGCDGTNATLNAPERCGEIFVTEKGIIDHTTLEKTVQPGIWTIRLFGYNIGITKVELSANSNQSLDHLLNNLKQSNFNLELIAENDSWYGATLRENLYHLKVSGKKDAWLKDDMSCGVSGQNCGFTLTIFHNIDEANKSLLYQNHNMEQGH